MDEDVGVFEDALHRRRIGDEVGREVAAVELHAFDELDFGAEALAFVDGDDAVLADLLHGFGDHLADFGVVVGGDGADLGDFLRALDLDRHLLELGRDVFDGLLHAALHLDGVDAGDDGLEAFVEDGFGEHGGGGGAVAGDVGGLAGDFLDHLGAHVLVGVFELNFLGDGDAVLGDGGRAEGFLQDDVAAFGAERDFDGSGELLNAASHRVAGFLIEGNHFCHGVAPWFGCLCREPLEGGVLC